jgi:fluoride exporter
VNTLLWVAAGGALGSVTRYGFNNCITRVMGESFPWGILLINVLGSFLIGMVGAYWIVRMPANDMARLFLTTGFLGGFTTFSAFAFDVLNLMQSDQNASAAIYVMASVVLSIVAVFVGFALVKAIA